MGDPGDKTERNPKLREGGEQRVLRHRRHGSQADGDTETDVGEPKRRTKVLDPYLSNPKLEVA